MAKFFRTKIEHEKNYKLIKLGRRLNTSTSYRRLQSQLHKGEFIIGIYNKRDLHYRYGSVYVLIDNHTIFNNFEILVEKSFYYSGTFYALSELDNDCWFEDDNLFDFQAIFTEIEDEESEPATEDSNEWFWSDSDSW